MSKSIALIPARGGSKRIFRKNMRPLAGHPLIAYTICAALDSGVFEKVLVSSDSTEILDTAARYGADCLRRPDEFASDTSPDIEWVRHALGLDKYELQHIHAGPIHRSFDTFSILRPTSPFRKPETIQRAMELWKGLGFQYTSLRAVERVSQHPGKMWWMRGQSLIPFAMQPIEQPFHDSQYAALPPVYVQNASLEIAHVSTVLTFGQISGPKVMAFETDEQEGFDLNTRYDWNVAELMIADGSATLPEVRERSVA